MLIARPQIISHATATIIKNIKSRLVDSDLPYIIISISTIQSWLILCILMAHPFCISLIKEIKGLLKKEVFKLVNPKDIPQGNRVFNSRFVNKIKNPGSNKAFKKSRLVVQAYNNLEKDLILTQSPTIQRVSQRLILCITAITQNNSIHLYLRDISQAYVQSATRLNRDFYIRAPLELSTALRVL